MTGPVCVTEVHLVVHRRTALRAIAPGPSSLCLWGMTSRLPGLTGWQTRGMIDSAPKCVGCPPARSEDRDPGTPGAQVCRDLLMDPETPSLTVQPSRMIRS